MTPGWVPGFRLEEVNAMPKNSPKPPDQQPEEKPRSPLFLIGAGLFLYAGAIGLFFYFVHLENTGTSTTMHAAIAFLYNMGGKWTVAIVLAALGTISLVVGILEALKPKT
jgi:hypothetical protein